MNIFNADIIRHFQIQMRKIPDPLNTECHKPVSNILCVLLRQGKCRNVYVVFFYEDFDTEYCRIRVGESWKLIKKKLIYDIHELVPFLCSMEYWAKQTDEFFQEDLKTKIEPSNRHELKCKIKI